jgi:hypothetical protein
MRVTLSLGPDGDSSVGLEPSKVLGDPGEGGGCAGLASQRGAEGDNADLGGETVSLGDDEGAAGIAVAGGDRSSVGVDAQLVGVDRDGSVVVSALGVSDDVQVDELHVGADSRCGCYQH